MDVPEVDIEEFARRRASGAFVLDVREPSEYTEAHVPGAVLVPLGEVQERYTEVPADGPVLVICKMGGRSLRAAEFLRANGYDATNVAGGTMAWIDAGREVAVGDDPG